ncbi:MAG: hypothetical protein HKN39_03370 [Flavobacteriales bacterium]|nr:hypothetical protein [Flavobacteriales bacterium]
MRAIVRTTLGILLCVFIAQDIHSQKISEEEKNRILEQRIELIAELNEEDELDYSHLTDVLDQYFDEPLDLNKASRDDLLELELISEAQITALEKHREKFGDLLSIYELQTIEGFTLYDLELLRPFIDVSRELDQSTITPRAILQNGKHEFFVMHTSILEQQLGFTYAEDGESTRYLGSAHRLYSRYRFRYKNNLSIGLTGEKDAGEEFFRGSQSGFDFYSGHAFWKYPGKINKVAIGDFQAQFGQGLTIWSGLAFGKSSEIASMKRNARGITPYASADENNFMRGVSVGGKLDDFEWTLFAASKKIDANLAATDTSDSGEPELVFTSFQTSGFHRTENELLDKDAIRETHLGANISFKKPGLKIGLSALKNSYEGNLKRNLQLYNQFEFNDNENSVLGLNYDWTYQNFNFFGEVARSENGNFATVNGVLMALDPSLSVVLYYRNLAKDFHSIISTVPIENSRSINEKGLLFGIDYHPSREWKLSAYMDRFEFPWLRFQTEAPSTGYDAFVQLQWRPSRAFKSYLRYRVRSKAENINDEIAPIDYESNVERVNVRWNLDYKISSSFRLKNRIEWIKRTEELKEVENGFLIYQDLLFQPLQSPLSVKLRYAIFDTDSYDSRLYAYESDLIYTFSIPAYYRTGTRWYAMVRYKFNRNAEIWARLSQFYYPEETTVLSGLNEITGNTRTDLKLLFRLRF